MADVTQNISAQLFVKELPPSSRADYMSCKNDFTSNYFRTDVEDIPSDAAVENAFQKQLSLSEYYKSPYVFDTMKRDYMSKTTDGCFESQEESASRSTTTIPAIIAPVVSKVLV
jgi:hypothetical protein